MTEEIEQRETAASVPPSGTGSTAIDPAPADTGPLDRVAPSPLVESRALWAGGGSGVLGLLVGLIAFWNKDVPMFDRDLSIGVVAILCCLVATAASYGWSLHALWQSRGRTPARGAGSVFRRVLAAIGLLLTHLAITLFATLGVFTLLAMSFRGLTLPLPHSAALVGVAAMLAGYASSLSGADGSTMHLATLLTMLMVGGVFTAMLTAPDPDWWIHHFSYLGGGGTSGLTFNGTLIVAGLVLITLADRLTNDLSRAPATAGGRTTIVRTLLIVAGACCALTGFFPYDWYEPIHMAFAFTMMLSIAALMVIAPRAIPGLPASFRLASLALLAVPIVSVLLFLFHSFSWTGAELVIALGCFAWLVLFIRTTNAVINEESVRGAS